MRKDYIKIFILIVSILVLLAVHVLMEGEDVAFAIGGMIVEIIVGLVVGGLVLFNFLLFIYNIIRPENKLNFHIIDKFIAGIWAVIIFKLFGIL